MLSKDEALRRLKSLDLSGRWWELSAKEAVLSLSG